jgi:hypothetical protein
MVMQGNNGESSNDHGETESFDSPHLMGVRVVVDHDPAVAAAALAEELNGELVFDREGAEVAFAARASAGRTDPVVLHDDEFDTLLAQADELGSLGERPTVDESAVAELRQLAVALARTDRIRMNTEVEFTETLNRRLSASSGMAVHPETIKQAALALTAAEGEVEEINKAIAELGDRPRPEQVRLEVPEAVPQMFDDESLEQQRRSRVFALSIGTIFAGVALVLLSFGVVVVIPVVVFLLGIIVAGAMMARSYSSEGRDDPGAREASALLASATGNAERTSEASARDRAAEEEWLARRSQFEAARERSGEKARSARRHWDTLARPAVRDHRSGDEDIAHGAHGERGASQGDGPLEGGVGRGRLRPAAGARGLRRAHHASRRCRRPRRSGEGRPAAAGGGGMGQRRRHDRPTADPGRAGELATGRRARGDAAHSPRGSRSRAGDAGLNATRSGGDPPEQRT